MKSPAIFYPNRIILCCVFATIALIVSTPQTTAAQSAASPCDTCPHVQLLTSGAKTSLRGLSVVTNDIVWVSGSAGTVGKSTDGGKTFSWITVPGYEKRDFRDIEAFDANTAIIMAIAEPADILKTTDGGKTWKNVYENSTKGMFLDAMEFFDAKTGIAVGDPIDGRIFLTHTTDGGNTWQDFPADQLPKADSGEGCFASSGTNIRYLDQHTTTFVTGGPSARLFIDNKPIALPILQGAVSTGANSVAVDPKRRNQLIVVGGDFSHDTLQQKNCFLTPDGGKTWIRPTIPPHGYRSCIEFIGGDKLICCGTSGVDLSTDNGLHWSLLDTTGFHTCRKAKKGTAVFLSGGNGRIAKLAL
jgi:photosystem II stability/assembly factor-like uncharacterized protein